MSRSPDRNQSAKTRRRLRDQPAVGRIAGHAAGAENNGICVPPAVSAFASSWLKSMPVAGDRRPPREPQRARHTWQWPGPR
jgi:hypothetical protein